MRIKKIVFALPVTLGLLSITGSLSYGKSVEFFDTTQHFASYETHAKSGLYPNDEYGSPKIQSLIVDWDDNSGLLQNVTVTLHSKPERELFDSLFINNDFGNGDSAIEGWDYLVHSGGSAHAGDSSGTLPGDGLWAVNDDYQYIYNTAGGREGHATSIAASSLNRNEWSTTSDPSTLIGTHTLGSYEILYDFSSFSISVDDGFSMAYAPWCANDVIVASYAGEPVPEPATMVLFGAGLAGIAGLRRRRTLRD